ncbi:MAG TPA: hypothetical protein VNM68_04925 [Candidatus Polarisedimenticolia bacterium]|nr:hypothetical protein [Candidatus Polarisedimenticolia bacterium]
MRLLPETLRWRGPLILSLMMLREALSFLLYWHVFHIFQTDIQQAPARTQADKEFDVKMYAGGADLERVIAEVASMGQMAAAEIESRFDRGQAVAVAYARNEAVGYSWISFSGDCELVWGTRCIVRPDEAVFHGSFTRPQWRGLGVHGSLDAKMSSYARRQGRFRIFGWVSVLNKPSLSLVKRLRKRKIMTLILVHIRGTNWVYRKAIGAALESHFSIRPASPRGRNL